MRARITGMRSLLFTALRGRARRLGGPISTSIGPTTALRPPRTVPLRGPWKRTVVPCLDVGELWRQKFGSARCQLLKVDIEGSEMDFFRVEQPFLEQVDTILMEWHKWRVQLPEVERLLATSGFKLAEVLEEQELVGTCLFRRIT